MRKILVAAAITLSCGALVAVEQAQTAQAQGAPASIAAAREPASAPDLSTPEAAVGSFVAALNKGDFKAAALCVAGTHLEGKLPDALQEMQEGGQQAKVHFAIKNLRVETKGDNALATMQVAQTEARKSGAASPQVTNQSLKLHREQGVWKIAIENPEAAMKSAGDMNHLFQGVAAILIRPEMLDSVFAGARSNAIAASCRSNLKQLALAAFQSLEDNDQKFNIKAASFQKSLAPYGVTKEFFICPEDTRDAKSGDKTVVSSYSFNANLQSVSLSKIKHPEKTIMIYEGKSGKLNFRHNGRASVAYADGHTGFANAQQAKSLNWKP